MTIVVLVFLGGVLTILSPCILPVLPFVFARSEQRFLTSGLPLLIGMTVTFAGIATLAAVGGAWAVRVNQYGRLFALVLLTVFAATLLSRRLADRLARPFVALGNRLIPQAPRGDTKVGLIPSLLLGVATGLLWAPCAGPVLGLVLTGAAISGPNTRTTLLLFAYAAGAAASLALALFAGGRVFAALKQSLGTGEWVRRALGGAVLVSVAAIAFGWDSGILTRLSLASTARLEQSLISSIAPQNQNSAQAANVAPAGVLAVEGQMPSLAGATAWLNSPPLTREALLGKVVVVDFWTYSCINCLRSLPYVKAWHERYKNYGLVVIGVHAPEFAFEKDPDNVRRAVAELGITYPVALDNNYAIWQGFDNRFWPAHYFIDGLGRIRAHHFGEGDYAASEQIIRQLLTEAGISNLPASSSSVPGATGAQAAPDDADMHSPETYLGYGRTQNFASESAVLPDAPEAYAAPGALALNQWALAGSWIVHKNEIVLAHAPGAIVFRFHARDLHLVVGPGTNGKPVRFRVTLDGAAPAANHGVDIDASGNGIIQEQRLYQLIRQSDAVREHTFSIE